MPRLTIKGSQKASRSGWVEFKTQRRRGKRGLETVLTPIKDAVKVSQTVENATTHPEYSQDDFHPDVSQVEAEEVPAQSGAHKRRVSAL